MTYFMKMATSTDDVEDEATEENILYDLTIQAEWPQEPETFVRAPKEKSRVSVAGRLASLSQRTIWTFLRATGIPFKSASPCSLPADLVHLVNCQLNWSIAVGREGKVIAVLQDQCVEIRSNRDDYSSIVGRGSLTRDPYPQWRRVSWSPDCTMVAVASSNGNVDAFDLVGAPLFTIPNDFVPNPKLPADLSQAVSGLIFTDYSGPAEWSAELCVVSYHGNLKSYYVDRDREPKFCYSFLFSQQYPYGISSIVYHPTYKMLILGGCSRIGQREESFSEASEHGITAWRILSGFPHCKLITDYSEDVKKAKISYWSRMKQWTWPRWRSETGIDGVFKMSLSPDGALLLVLHYSGKLTLWQIPSLRKQASWEHDEQPYHDDISPEFNENPQRKKCVKDLIQSKQLIDINWWSNESFILARGTGAVTVSSAVTLKNLLGSSPEWFEPAPHIKETQDEGFLGLECESRFPQKRHLLDDADEDFEDSDDEDLSWVHRSKRYTKRALYYVTDSERFQPPRKRPKIVTRTYRLVCLKSTTPEELYARKIDNEEYGEALALAKAYGLDCDLVYQRQWRKSPVSVASIQDYLSKISKRSWVLHECLERAPVTLDAMGELLKYGLRGTDLQALIAIGNHEDQGRFILCDEEDGLYEDVDMFDQEAFLELEEKKQEQRKRLLSQVDFNCLTLDQKELCRARLKLLQYIDRLETYELILGGQQAAVERFDHKFFEKFRAQNILDAATNYARMSDWRAVDALFTYHGKDLLDHRLAVLSNFPETTSPSDFQSLLPEIGNDGDVLSWECLSWRDEDWSELGACRSVVDPTPKDLGQNLYEEYPDLKKFCSSNPSHQLLSQWYSDRASDIERQSRQVDNALGLVKYGIDRGVTGLTELCDDLVTMETLVYECHVEDSVTFENLRHMDDLERMQLLMASSSQEMYIKNVYRWLVPFLERCDSNDSGSYRELLQKYINKMAQDDLTLCVLLFENSKLMVPIPVIQSPEDLMSFALAAIYTNSRDDQLDLAYEIFKCLPQRGEGTQTVESLKHHTEVDKLEKHLRASTILSNNGVKKPVSYVKESQNDSDEAKNLMIRLSRVAGRRVPALSESEWMKLHADIVDLQDKVFRCISPGICHEIFVESLLCSSKHDTITLAGRLIERCEEESKPSRQPQKSQTVMYQRGVELVLGAAQEYFNSSANLMDSCMDLARSCLNLIKDTPAPIQEELDLIGSLALLDDFGVSVLPLQVRLNKDRMHLVQTAVVNRPNAYKQTQKLLRLGHLLRVAPDKSIRDGMVHQLIASTALERSDFSFALEICQLIIENGYGPGWTVCMDLAEQEAFQNIRAKADLLSFAVTYCSPDMIEPILQAKCLLETQILIDTVNTDIEGQRSEYSTPRESPFSAKAAMKQTQEILSSTSRKTKSVLLTVTDKKWWKNTLQVMKAPAKQDQSRSVMDDDRNVKLAKQGVHPFYRSLMEDCYENNRADNYEGYPSISDPDVETSENILRTAKLEEMLTFGEKFESAGDILLKLMSSALPVDASLGLAYLLSLPNGFDAQQCLDEFPSTAVSLQLAVYYYALQIYSNLKPCNLPLCDDLYRHDPKDVIQKVIDHVTGKTTNDWPPEVSDLILKLQYYQDLLEDYAQAKILQGLGRGVDVVRFTEDNDYKHETILGLAMTLEGEVFDIAVSLAHRYDLSLWEVYMSHLEYLFSDSGLTTVDVEQRVNELLLLETLLSRSSEFIERMFKYVYPCIAGTDHVRLLYFYSVLDGCQSDVPGGITAGSHVRLLKKIKPAAPGIDYKKLMDVTEGPMSVIRPVLNNGNVHVIAKLANKIPNPRGGFLHPSVVYSSWVAKFFWEGDQLNKNAPESTAQWMHRYEACGDFIQRLLPADMCNFIDAIIFVKQARTLLEFDCRLELLRRALKYCRQQTGRKKKAATSESMGWDEASSILQQSLSHLELLSNDFLQTLQLSEDEQQQKYVEMFDLSKGHTDEIKSLLMTIMLDGQAPDLVEDFLSVSPVESWTVRTVLQEAVSLIVQKLRNPTETIALLESRDVFEVLQTMVETVRDHQEASGDLISQEDVMQLLRPFCSDMSVAVKPRLDILHILEKSFNMSEEDLILLTLYRTEAVVMEVWPMQKLSAVDIQSDVARQELYQRLLKESSSSDHYLSLSNLLRLWPPLPAASSSSPNNNSWVNLFAAMATQQPESINRIPGMLTTIPESTILNLECVRYIYELLLSKKSVIEAVKVVLILNQKELFSDAMTQLNEQEQATNDEELILLILEKHLVQHIVSSAYYPIIIEYLLSNQTNDMESHDCRSVQTVAGELKEAGFVAEAGSLLLQARSTHPVLRTFDAALGMYGRWFKS